MFEILGNGKIRMVRGDTVEFNVTASYKEDGSPYTLQEGDEIIFTLKKKSTDTVPLIQKTGPDVIITPDDTSELSFGSYVYDVQLNFADGSVDTIVPKNTFEIMEEVTW